MISRAASKLKFQTGDVPTQADYENLHDSVLWYDEVAGYNVYTALITQAGVLAPVATVFQNTLGDVPVFSYLSPGAYKIASPAFTIGKTFVLLGFGKAGSFGYINYDFQVSDIRLYCINTAGAPEDGLLSNASIEIRVYP